MLITSKSEIWVKRLVQQGGHAIRVLGNFKTLARDDLSLVAQFREIKQDADWGTPSGVELVFGHILDDRLALRVAKGCDIIIHFAANTGVGPSVRDPRADVLACVVGTFNYIEAARINKIPRFIFACSGAPVGEAERPIHGELPSHPVSPYGADKLAGEAYCSAYKRTFGIDIVILRLGNVYGLGSIYKVSVVAKFIKHALAGKPLEIYGDGTQTRDFIYIDHLIDAVLLSATIPGIGGEIFQIATDREISVGELAKNLLALLKAEDIENIKVINTETRREDVKRNFSDTTKARHRLGWQVKTEINYCFKKTISNFLSTYRII